MDPSAPQLRPTTERVTFHQRDPINHGWHCRTTSPSARRTHSFLLCLPFHNAVDRRSGHQEGRRWQQRAATPGMLPAAASTFAAVAAVLVALALTRLLARTSSTAAPLPPPSPPLFPSRRKESRTKQRVAVLRSLPRPVHAIVARPATSFAVAPSSPIVPGSGAQASDAPPSSRPPARSSLASLDLDLAPNEKLVHFIRHGQGHHNQAQADWYAAGKPGEPYWPEHDPDGRYEDAELTRKGLAQARALRARTASIAPELLVVSPLRRAILTGVTAFDRHIRGEVDPNVGAQGGGEEDHPAAGERAHDEDKSVHHKHGSTAQQGTYVRLPVLAREECHEIAGKHTCDRRLSKTRLTELYPMVDFSQVDAEEDPFWGDGTWREPLKEVAGRAAAFMAWLEGREETHIAVACHGVFLLSLFNGVLTVEGEEEEGGQGGQGREGPSSLRDHFATGEMRSVVLRWERDANRSKS